MTDKVFSALFLHSLIYLFDVLSEASLQSSYKTKARLARELAQRSRVCKDLPVCNRHSLDSAKSTHPPLRAKLHYHAPATAQRNGY